MKKEILKELKNHFRPEFLNRIDKTCVFHALTSDNIKKIVALHLDQLQERLSHRKITLISTPGAIDILADLGYDPKYGARPVRRAISEHVEDLLTTKFLNGEFVDGDKLKIVKKGKGVDVVKA